MTEGIIQKVFKRYLDANAEPHPVIRGKRLLLQQLQQELIQEIKKYEFDIDKYFDDTVKSILVGED